MALSSLICWSCAAPELRSTIAAPAARFLPLEPELGGCHSAAPRHTHAQGAAAPIHEEADLGAEAALTVSGGRIRLFMGGGVRRAHA